MTNVKILPLAAIGIMTAISFANNLGRPVAGIAVIVGWLLSLLI